MASATRAGAAFSRESLCCISIAIKPGTLITDFKANSTDSAPNQRDGRWLSPAGISGLAVLLILALAAIRRTGLPDLMDHEQQRQAAYVLDIVQNHHWVIQQDEAGEIASKPPLFTWLGAVGTYLFGSCEPYGIRVMAMLSTLATVLLLIWISSRIFSARAAMFTAVVYIICAPVARQVWLARMDALLPLTVACLAIAGWLAWQEKSWIWFWIAAAAGVLTKGPIALLGATGLVAMFWGSGAGSRRGPWRGHVAGILLFLLLTAGWFALACHTMPGVYHKLIDEEFLDQAVRQNKGFTIGSRFYEPPFYFLVRFLPWSFLCVPAIWRIFRKPKEDSTARRFERYLACWLLVGMIPFCLSTHQRGDLLFPLYPAGALLAGRELARWFERCSQRGLLAFVSVSALIGMGYFYVSYHRLTNDYRQQTQAVEVIARAVDRQAGPDFPLTYVDGPFALEAYLNTMRPLYFGESKKSTGIYDADRLATFDYTAAAELLEGKEAAFVVVFNTKELRRRLSNPALPLYDLVEAEFPAKNELHILSNRPKLQAYPDMAMGIGALLLESHGLKWIHAAEHDFTVEGGGSLLVINHLDTAQSIRIRHGSAIKDVTIDPTEVWSITYPSIRQATKESAKGE